MMSDQPKKERKSSRTPMRVSDLPSILIVEDDPDQLEMLVRLAILEIKSLLADDTLPSRAREKILSFNIIKVPEMKSLKRAVSFNKNVVLAIVDCNLPDEKWPGPARSVHQMGRHHDHRATSCR